MKSRQTTDFDNQDLVAQLVEHATFNRVVVGSIPTEVISSGSEKRRALILKGPLLFILDLGTFGTFKKRVDLSFSKNTPPGHQLQTWVFRAETGRGQFVENLGAQVEAPDSFGAGGFLALADGGFSLKDQFVGFILGQILADAIHRLGQLFDVPLDGLG